MDERRIRKLAQGYVLFSDTEKHVMPIIGKCLDGITRAGNNVNERNVSVSQKRVAAEYLWKNHAYHIVYIYLILVFGKKWMYCDETAKSHTV